ncbi:MAG: complex I subunit 4 family protein [Methermicoccaceae archaeon]
MVSLYISAMILIPFIGALIAGMSKNNARYVALIVSTIPLAISLIMYVGMIDASSLSYLERYGWLSALGINLKFAVDGLSLPLVILTNIIFPLTFLYSIKWEVKYGFFPLMLILQSALIGVFTALDFIIFYIFWELTLIPLYFVIGMFGGERREHAAMKFFIYTHVASLVMLLGIFALYFSSGIGTFDIFALISAFPALPDPLKDVIFAAILFGFLVKLPVVPFHGWLPDAYGEAPVAGTVVIAALLSKMGAYGLLRVCMPMLPFTPSVDTFVMILAILGVVSILYCALLALAQQDLKKMVAYSSVSHMGYIVLGVASLSAVSVSGAMFNMFSHGLIIALLFMSIGVIYAHTGTQLIPRLGGITYKMPVLAFIVMGGFLASLGLPGMSGFVAEFLTLMGAYATLPVYVLLALVGVLLTATYYIWAMQRALFGPINEKLMGIKDVTAVQAVPMAVLLGLIVFLGLDPAPILNMIDTFTSALEVLI